jgi:hypothetical protein
VSTYDSPIHMMEVQGGSFVRALAECYGRADPRNRQRLRDAFPEYFQLYEDRFRRASAPPAQGKP